MITLTVKDEKPKGGRISYDEIPRPQVFRGRALNGPLAGRVGIFLKASARQGGIDVHDSILYRLDHTSEVLRTYVGTKTDFVEYEPLDLELVVTSTKEGE